MDNYEHRLQQLLGEQNVWQENSATNPPSNIDSLADRMDAMSAQEKRKAAARNNPPASSTVKSGVASVKKPLELTKKPKFDVTGLRCGEQADRNTAFCPWKLVKGYPHQFIGKQNKPKASPFFSAHALHKNQPWDLYYIHIPHSTSEQKPIILVPTYQLQSHLDNINSALGINLTIPDDKNGEKFCVTFGTCGTPLPRFLGRSTSAGGLDALKKRVPIFNALDDIKDLAPRIQEDYINFLAAVKNASKEAKKKKSEKNRRQRRLEHIQWGRSLKRVQRYMGLREKASPDTQKDSPTVADGPEVPISEPEGSIIFVSIDIEAYEFSQDLITEVGLAIFDTLDIQGQQPGANGSEWFPLIQGYHLRVKENSWADNKVYVKGCANKFDFGDSAFIPEQNVARATLNLIERAAKVNSTESRPVVLVFHDTASDVAFLGKLGIQPEHFKGLLEVVDSRDIYQHREKAPNPTKLGSVLGSLGIPHWHLHNAGNDAVYTMQALIALAVMQRKKSRDGAASGVQSVPVKTEEDEGWETGGEESDGGNVGDPPRTTHESRVPVMSWDSEPDDSPTKKTTSPPPTAQPVEKAPQKPYHHCVMDFDTSDEGEGKAW